MTCRTRTNPVEPFLGFWIIMMVVTMLLAATPATSFGQGNHAKNVFFGFGGGPMVFLGDIKQYRIMPSSDELRYGGSVHLGYQITPAISLRLGGLHGKVAGELLFDSFETAISEVNLVVAFRIIGNDPHRRASLNLLLGGGFVSYKGEHSDLWGDHIVTPIENQSVTLPLGLAVSYRLSSRLFLTLESTNSITFKDDLDNVKQDRNDVFNTSFLGLQFRFGKSTERFRVGCPY